MNLLIFFIMVEYNKETIKTYIYLYDKPFFHSIDMCHLLDGQ